MIQRIQSLYLTLVILLTLFLFRGNVFNFAGESGEVIKLLLTGVLMDNEGRLFAQVSNLWLLTVILVVIPFMSLITILMFRNRKIQLLFAILVVMMSSGLIIALFYYAYSVMDNYKMVIIPGFKMVIPLIILIFSILAYRGILKDDRLVKSYDRLR